MTRLGAALAVLAFCVSSARAHDRWELLADDTAAGKNLLRHGVTQADHDLEGPASNPDRDWMRFVAKARHSYEARVSGLYWDNGCGTAPCPLFDRVDAAGAVLTAGLASEDDLLAISTATIGRTVRWIATSGGEEHLRVVGDQLINFDRNRRYDIVYYDTTLFLPRWNNTATQTTVLLLQNTTSVAVTGFAYFHGGGGALLATVPVSVPPHGLQVIGTGSVPALAGASGAAQIAHLGGYGALAGKAVALEPATGFTFDTAIMPLPR